jgi:hypothetical protein
MMAVHDRGEHRDVEIESSYLGLLFKSRAKKTLDRVVRALS